MKNLIRFAMALVAAHMAAPLWAAAPPGPYFNGFENNTNGWFDSTNGGDGTITRRHSGYTNGGGYASGINSAAGSWHARLTGNPSPPCDHMQNGTPCYGPYTNWGGYSATFPPGGYLTQVDIYLDVAWAATHPDYRFDWDSSINNNSGNFLRDFVFNAGTSPTMTPEFFVNASTNATRSGAYPENPCPDPGPTSNPPNPCRTPVSINVSGWYTFRHTFRSEAGFLAVDFDIIQQSTNASIAHWTIRAGDPMSMVGGNRYGWFVIEEIPDLAIDNSLRTGVCHSGDGDGDVEERDSHKRHHQHFHKNSTCGDQGGGEEDNVNSDDEDSGSHFESNSVQSSTFTADEDSQAVTMIGTGTHDGLPVGFTMIAVDNGNLAPGVFTLILTDGYAFTGDLTSGTIAIY
jgi:hypothetical protein